MVKKNAKILALRELLLKTLFFLLFPKPEKNCRTWLVSSPLAIWGKFQHTQLTTGYGQYVGKVLVTHLHAWELTTSPDFIAFLSTIFQIFLHEQIFYSKFFYWIGTHNQKSSSGTIPSPSGNRPLGPHHKHKTHL